MLPITALIVSFTVSFILMPIIIKVFKSIDLLDIPDRRKIHKGHSPSLGGIAIFIGFGLALFTSLTFSDFVEVKYLISSIIMIFLLGVRDDISSLEARQKFAVQGLAALIVVFISEIHFSGLYGVFGLIDLPFGLSQVVSVVFIVGLTNSFNLIDGIDGLAGSLGALAAVVLGWSFLILGFESQSVIAFSLSGALIAFLFFNWYPSKIFMGDTGSMLVGFVVAVLSIVVINGATNSVQLPVNEAIPLVLSVLLIPIYDTIKVFIVRIIHGRSPFFPDRNHIHHCLLKIGLNHGQATLILFFVTLMFIWFSYSFSSVLGLNYSLVLLISIAVTLGGILDLMVSQKKYMGRKRSSIES